MQAKFDKILLNADDLDLLEQFRVRRADFERQIEESNIIYHKYTCPACGFPTLDVRGDYETCIVCEWEDDGSDKDEFSVSGLNHMSLVEARVNVAGMIRDFEKQNSIDYTLDKMVRSIKVFEEKCAKDLAGVNPDFNVHLKNVLWAYKIDQYEKGCEYVLKLLAFAGGEFLSEEMAKLVHETVKVFEAAGEMNLKEDRHFTEVKEQLQVSISNHKKFKTQFREAYFTLSNQDKNEWLNNFLTT